MTEVVVVDANEAQGACDTSMPRPGNAAASLTDATVHEVEQVEYSPGVVFHCDQRLTRGNGVR